MTREEKMEVAQKMTIDELLVNLESEIRASTLDDAYRWSNESREIRAVLKEEIKRRVQKGS